MTSWVFQGYSSDCLAVFRFTTMLAHVQCAINKKRTKFVSFFQSPCGFLSFLMLQCSSRPNSPHDRNFIGTKHPPVTIIHPTSRKYLSAVCQTRDLESIYCNTSKGCGKAERRTHALQMTKIIQYAGKTSAQPGISQNISVVAALWGGEEKVPHQ